MPTTLIKQNPTFSKKVEGERKLAIAELFCDTIQGEGVSMGCPATFLRLQGCTLSCTWCDSIMVWPNGNEYTFEEIFKLFESVGLIQRFMNGQRLILTGGSPLKQQKQLIEFIQAFKIYYGFIPIIEIENEAVLVPDPELVPFIYCWNNSPKLANSGMKERVRVKPEAICTVASLSNSWFKFVVNSEEDWKEIVNTYIEPGYINVSQVILMPEGKDREELEKTREKVLEMAIKYCVRYSDRLHIIIWNKMTGV